MKYPIGSHLTQRETQPISPLSQLIVLRIWACFEALLSEATNTAYGYIGCFCCPTPHGVGGLKSGVASKYGTACEVPPHTGGGLKFAMQTSGPITFGYRPARGGIGITSCISAHWIIHILRQEQAPPITLLRFPMVTEQRQMRNYFIPHLSLFAVRCQRRRRHKRYITRRSAVLLFSLYSLR